MVYGQSIAITECGLYLDNRLFILASKQTCSVLTNQNRDEKADLLNK